MAFGTGDLLQTMQQGVIAINNLNQVVTAQVALAAANAAAQPHIFFDSRTAAAAATIASASQSITTAGYSAAGDGGGALYKKVNGSTTGGFQSIDGAWWALAVSIVDPRMLGAKWDNTTDDGAAINSAISLALPVRCPPGTALSSINITMNQSILFVGAGWVNTVIKFTAAGAGMIVSANNVDLRDFEVTSSIAAGSRTVAGIKITGSQAELTFVQSNGHLYGFWNQGTATEWQHCFAQLNASDGFFIDGSVTAQNEIGFYECQANGNGGNGFNWVGPGQGLRGTSLTAASNAASGIAFSNNMNDIWLAVVEISTNGLAGIAGTGCSDIQLDTLFLEASLLFPNLQLINCPIATVTNVFSQGAQNATNGNDIFISGQDCTIAGGNLQSSAVAGLRIGAACSNFVATGININNLAATGFTHTRGITIETASPIVFVGCTVTSSNVAVGVVPAGSRIMAIGMTTVSS